MHNYGEGGLNRQFGPTPKTKKNSREETVEFDTLLSGSTGEKGGPDAERPKPHIPANKKRGIEERPTGGRRYNRRT